MKQKWIILQVLILIYVLIELLILDNDEAIVKLILIEFAFSFPISIFIGVLNHILISSMKVVSETNIIFLVFNWGLFFLFGYIQWFVLLPKIYCKLWGKKLIYAISINRYLLFIGIITISLYISAIVLL